MERNGDYPFYLIFYNERMLPWTLTKSRQSWKLYAASSLSYFVIFRRGRRATFIRSNPTVSNADAPPAIAIPFVYVFYFIRDFCICEIFQICFLCLWSLLNSFFHFRSLPKYVLFICNITFEFPFLYFK